MQQHSAVDVTGIGRRLKGLPWEISESTSWTNGEVSRGHSNCGYELSLNGQMVSLSREGLNMM